MVKFGLEFVPRDLFWKTTYYAIQAEKGLFDYLWITDHFTNRNVYVALSMILAYTDKIMVGTGVTNPYLINPVVTAGAIASLNEIAPGRVVCGIGVGDRTTLEQAGVQAAKPLLAIKESVQVIRAMTTGGEVNNFQGEIFKIPGARLGFRVRNPIPIYVGAQGRKMLNLAAEVGDGVLINASHPKDLREAIEYIKDGIFKVGKTLDMIDIAAYSSFSVHEEAKKAFKAAVPVVAFIVAGSPDAVLEKHEIDRETGAKIRDFLIKGNLGEAFALVTPEMVNAFAVSGTPEECIEKISTIVKLGVTQFVAGSPIGSNVRKSINILTAKIIPHFKEMPPT